jgi:outer membrane protein assembly factor BamB
MTRSARRRWSRDLESLVDGLAAGPSGPIAVHTFDAPAGDKWADDVIPGKVALLDRSNGETLWSSPCEVGYGRGFGAGFATSGDVVVLGPSQSGHAIVRMAAHNGELLGVERVPEFDEALVDAELSICVCANQILAFDTNDMAPRWSHKPKDIRFHGALRSADRVLVVQSRKGSRDQGIVSLDARTGRVVAEILEPRPGAFYGAAAGDGLLVVPVADVERDLPAEQVRELALARLVATQDDDDLEDEDDDGGGRRPGLVAYRADAPGRPVWCRALPRSEDETVLAVDSGKVYAVRGTTALVHDLATGRELGSAIVPGLDEAIAWLPRNGAFIVAEENRISVFEMPD